MSRAISQTANRARARRHLGRFGALSIALSGVTIAAGAKAEARAAMALSPGWSTTTVASGEFLYQTELAPGRNDGVTRIYAVSLAFPQNSTIKEYTFDDSLGAWANTSSVALPFYSETVAVADARNDGTLRLYAGGFIGGWAGDVVEVTRMGDTWSSAFLEPFGSTTGQQYLGVVVGAGRSDGLNRIYFTTGSAPPNNVAREYSYADSDWREAPIHTPLARYGLSDGQRGIAIQDGRGDGVVRVYQGVLDALSFDYYLYEFSWTGAQWEPTSIASGRDGVPAVAVADGRNDGVERVYAVAASFGVYEYTFADGAWSRSAEIPIGGITDMGIGPGRNDGRNRIYLTQGNPGTVWEASFDAGAWTVSTIGTPGGNLWRIRVGWGRGDELTRIYAAGTAGMFEIAWPGSGSEVPAGCEAR